MLTKPNQISGFTGLFYLISGAAERGDFGWLSYDSKFRQSVVVSFDKPWGISDPSIWLQCMGRSFYQYSPYSRCGYSGNSETIFCLNFNKKDEFLYPNCKYLLRCSNCKIDSHPAIKCPERFANSLSKDVCKRGWSRSPFPPVRSKHRKP